MHTHDGHYDAGRSPDVQRLEHAKSSQFFFVFLYVCPPPRPLPIRSLFRLFRVRARMVCTCMYQQGERKANKSHWPAGKIQTNPQAQLSHNAGRVDEGIIQVDSWTEIDRELQREGTRGRGGHGNSDDGGRMHAQ